MYKLFLIVVQFIVCCFCFAKPMRSMLGSNGAEMQTLEESGIIPVEYIESSGSQYIDTGIYFANNNKTCSFFLDFMPKSYIPRNNVYYAFFGISNAGSRAFGINFTSFQSRGLVIMTSSYALSTGITSLTRYSVFVSPQESSINGNPLSVTYATDVQRSGRLFLFAINAIDSSGTSKVSPQDARVWGCKIWMAGDLVFDAIPVRFLNESNEWEGAMLDLVSGNLCLNAGSGSFIIGPDL